jgi:hypothetical protein
MSIGSVSSGAMSTAVDAQHTPSRSAVVAEKTVADHVAAADDQEPIRSASDTRGTLVDTYL